MKYFLSKQHIFSTIQTYSRSRGRKTLKKEARLCYKERNKKITHWSTCYKIRHPIRTQNFFLSCSFYAQFFHFKSSVQVRVGFFQTWQQTLHNLIRDRFLCRIYMDRKTVNEHMTIIQTASSYWLYKAGYNCWKPRKKLNIMENIKPIIEQKG